MTEESVRGYRRRIHEAATAAGRRPEDITILFAIQPVVVSSAEEADRIVAASLDPDEATLRWIAEHQSSDLETDLTGLDLDRPLDRGIFGEHVSHGSIRRLLGEHDEDAPLRRILAAHARKGRLHDGSGWVGTAEELADRIDEYGSWGNDGVLLWGDLHPVTVHRTLDELVPILRRRGILRREYEPTLRANLRPF